MTQQQIELFGEKYLLIGETDGPIARQEDYENGRTCFALLIPNGDIIRHGNKIGTRSDIKYLGQVEVNVSDDAILNLLGLGFPR
jgi:hypothetical protein